MWTYVKNQATKRNELAVTVKKPYKELPVVLLTRRDMYMLADFMILSNVVIDDGVEFGLANELSVAYQIVENDLEV